MSLPPNFTLASLMNGEMPGDITLGQARTYALSTPELCDLAKLVKAGRTLGIRFLRQPRGNELPDEMSLHMFRVMVKHGHASISIDDGSGGLRVLEDA